MMYNFATNAPPEELTISGREFPINADFRVWVEINDIFMYRSDDVDALIEAVRMAFESPDEVMSWNHPDEVFDAMLEFLKGYPKEQLCGADPQDKRDEESIDQTVDFDFKYDLNWIVIAIRNQSGIDLSYRCKFFHWWQFLLEFQSLEDRHYISRLREIRGYKGDDRELLRQKAHFALPVRYTAAERQEKEEFESLFK